MQAWQLSLVLAFVLAIAELLTLSFLLLGCAFGLVAVAAVEYAAGGPALGRDLVVFALVSVVAVLVLRRAFGRREKAGAPEEEEDVNDY